MDTPDFGQEIGRTQPERGTCIVVSRGTFEPCGRQAPCVWIRIERADRTIAKFALRLGCVDEVSNLMRRAVFDAAKEQRTKADAHGQWQKMTGGQQ
jgi:hypothetical protein